MEALIPDRLLSELNQLQQRVFANGLPVLVLFEGSSGRVIGRVNSELIRCLEPRGIIYTHFDPDGQEGPGSILDLFQRTPGKGQIGLFDRSWYSSVIEQYNKDENAEELDAMLGITNNLERYLVSNGVLVIKIVLRVTESALAEYGREYGPQVPKRSFLSMDHLDPKKYREALLDLVYEKTDTEHAPWNMVWVKGIRETVVETVETIMGIIERTLDSEPAVRVTSENKRACANPRKDLKLEKKCRDYDSLVNKLSEELGELQMELSLSGRSMVVCFEGWDAAGKGSCIKHLCHALNPRGYEVLQTKAPTEEELSHTYLWRFIKGVPEKGRITVFDRTWYGRMLVEHIEGFCTEEEYLRSPFEINAFEKIMVREGIILLKFWLDITPGEQLARFKKREGDQLKQWKITAEDWRNRSKWDKYDAHVDVMMESTNTEQGPWIVVESNNKKYARVKVLSAVVDALKKELNG
ncbi:MAG: hypothetical protein FWC29_04065 [Methanomassiliicoccaceae archaeon]|nr:hypothetical protein [Methanomassiliicoccaceae archaeon]